ncbi:MAG: periplasmic heavy metal sensor [Alphaproteobacteria bacterium]|nr:periplasmic heavy metal sensor [Alphaproteobacteria bacterium]
MDEKQQVAPKPRRWIKVIFVLSLGLNILVLGLVGGAFLRGGPPDRVRVERDIAALGLRVYFRALNEGDRADIRTNFKQYRGQIKAGRGLFRAHLKALATALTAEPYDQAAVAAVLSQQAGVVSENMAVGQRVLLAQIEMMTKSDREAFAAALKKPAKRRRP